MSDKQFGGIISYCIASAGNNNSKSAVIARAHTSHSSQPRLHFFLNSSYLPFIHKNKFFSALRSNVPNLRWNNYA